MPSALGLTIPFTCTETSVLAVISPATTNRPVEPVTSVNPLVVEAAAAALKSVGRSHVCPINGVLSQKSTTKAPASAFGVKVTVYELVAPTEALDS